MHIFWFFVEVQLVHPDLRMKNFKLVKCGHFVKFMDEAVKLAHDFQVDLLWLTPHSASEGCFSNRTSWIYSEMFFAKSFPKNSTVLSKKIEIGEQFTGKHPISASFHDQWFAAK